MGRRLGGQVRGGKLKAARRGHKRSLPRSLLLPLAAAITAAVGPAIPAAVAAAATTTTGSMRAHVGTVAPLPAGSVDLGNVDPAKELTFDVTLAPRDPAALARFAIEVSTSSSPLYHHYLAKGQFAAEFGPTPGTIAAVESGLRSEGLHPLRVSANRLTITVRDSLRTVSRGMRVPFRTFLLPDGRRAFANTTSPLISGVVARDIQGVVGLDDVARFVPEGLVPAGGSPGTRSTPSATPQTSGVSSCSGANDAASTGGFTAQDLAGAYGLSGLYGTGDFGSGVQVGVYELATYSSSDISTFESCYGISTPVDVTQVDGGAGTSGGGVEDTLDIEDVASLAPGVSSIAVYEGPNNTSGALDTYAAMINADVPVISTSWGICEPQFTGQQSENTLFQQAAAQGETVLSAAGDSGSADCYLGSPTSTLAVDDPASQPFVTGVGGTTLTLSSPD